MVFPNHRYISFEEIDQRIFAQTDPRAFLRDNKNEYGLILDEIQHVPDLLSYVQTEIDEHKRNRPKCFLCTIYAAVYLNQ